MGYSPEVAASFLWYDLETFGRHPRWDRIAQFAAVRTDGGFEPTEEPVMLYCRLTPDVLPDPDACLVTGITPDLANDQGIVERDFAARIYAEMIRPGTCTAGYNNIRFDDEFIRSLFYRNFYDPYRREYDAGNSRWDIIDLLRMCHDLRPEGISWPTKEDGRPSFALEDLAAANNMDTSASHDALHDVRTTIAVARLVKEAQPKLFRYYFDLRRKEVVRRRLNLARMEPVLHTSGMFSSDRGCTTIVLPLGARSGYSNSIIAYDLRRNPADWIDEPDEEIRRRVFTRQEELGEVPRIPFKEIHLNRSPAIAPLATLDPTRAAALGLDVDSCLRHAEVLKQRGDIIQKVWAVYSDLPYRHFEDPELQIYSGDFFPDEDREEFEVIRRATPQELRDHPPRLYDRRGPELLWRYIARNFPESLDPEERLRWKSFCASRILTPEPENVVDFGTFRRTVKNRLARIDTPARDKVVLKKLDEYGDYLEKTILS